MDEVAADFGPDDDVRARPRRAKAKRGTVAPARGGPVGAVRYCARTANAIVARVESGESVRGICEEAGMPNRSTVTAWTKAAPRFEAAMRQAREAAGWLADGSGRPPKFDAASRREVCRRLSEGEPMTRVCDDPGMPSLSLVYRWRARDADFAAQVRLAREVAAERFCDLGWEIACAITPQTAYATHVQLTQLRWTAANLAPRRFGKVKAVTGEAEAEIAAEAAEAAGPKETVFRVRHFERVIGEDGQAYVREAPELPEGMACVRAPSWQEERAQEERAQEERGQAAGREGGEGA